MDKKVKYDADFEEKLRQEGREEVLDYMTELEFVNYSVPENVYFKVLDQNGAFYVLPWKKIKEY